VSSGAGSNYLLHTNVYEALELVSINRIFSVATRLVYTATSDTGGLEGRKQELRAVTLRHQRLSDQAKPFGDIPSDKTDASAV
jgi:hypothetical protein